MTTDRPAHQRSALSNRLQTLSSHCAAGPWFDPLALYALKRWMFPLSRLWAAATEAEGDVPHFLQLVPVADNSLDHGRVQDALTLAGEARLTAIATDAYWNRIVFEDHTSTNDQRHLAERARRSRRHAYYATRRHFRFLRTNDTPLAKQIIEPPDQVAARFGGLVANTDPLAAAPERMPKVTVSQTIIRPTVTEHWLRFNSPSATMNDICTAHVYTPTGIKNPPTIIIGHGVCVEIEHWKGLLDEVATLVSNGVRVIRPEAPWHGYRTPHGYYGGERIIAVFPTGALDAFSAAIQEWAVLADWARQTSAGPLAFGGTSLGALIAQRAADESRTWPQRLKPEALFLITHSGNLLETIMTGDLTRLWGDPEKARAAGWTLETAATYLDQLNPGPYSAISSANIVSVLGSRDRVTPFASGKALLDRWGVPEQNRFVWWRGHFSIPMTLLHRQAPVKRFCQILNRL